MRILLLLVAPTALVYFIVWALVRIASKPTPPIQTKEKYNMTIEEQDARCNKLFDKLDHMRAAGQTESDEYMQTLKALQSATRERLRTIQVVTL